MRLKIATIVSCSNICLNVKSKNMMNNWVTWGGSGTTYLDIWTFTGTKHVGNKMSYASTLI